MMNAEKTSVCVWGEVAILWITHRYCDVNTVHESVQPLSNHSPKLLQLRQLGEVLQTLLNRSKRLGELIRARCLIRLVEFDQLCKVD